MCSKKPCFESSKFHNCKIGRFQSSKASKVQRFKVSNFQKLKSSKFHKNKKRNVENKCQPFNILGTHIFRHSQIVKPSDLNKWYCWRMPVTQHQTLCRLSQGCVLYHIYTTMVWLIWMCGYPFYYYSYIAVKKMKSWATFSSVRLQVFFEEHRRIEL